MRLLAATTIALTIAAPAAAQDRDGSGLAISAGLGSQMGGQVGLG